MKSKTTNGTKNVNPAIKEKREKCIYVYVSASELGGLRARAGGVRLPVFLRRAGLGQALPAIVPAEHLPYIAELGRIGNNLNQLALRANRAGNAGAVESFDDALAVVLDLRAALRAPVREATA